jgi:hypothetical protein
MPDPQPGACPDWCDMKPGHGWDSQSRDGTVVSRGHGFHIGDVRVGGRDRAGVEVFGVEEFIPGAAPITSDPVLAVWAGDGSPVEMTSTEVRKFARLLFTAADKLEALHNHDEKRDPDV